ncbi:DUF1963 domain-containing protein [Spirosoma koreense]
MNKKDFRQAIGRRAVRLNVGGFRPTGQPQASWFGKVLLAKAGESWPRSNGKSMLALCQVNLDEFPFKPEPVQDLAFLTVFIDAGAIPSHEDLNHTNWCLRTYQSLDELVPLEQPPVTSPIKPFQMRPERIDADFPLPEDCPVSIPARYEETFYEQFPNVDGIKFGGWPTLIQGDIFWSPSRQHLLQPTFAFQIDSVLKAHWQWGDNGIAYFGRGTTAGSEDEWVFSWQCY